MNAVVVTGSSGFIGSALVEHLRRHGIAEVHGFDIRPPRWRPLDARDHSIDLNDRTKLVEAMRSLAPDTVVHLAARTDLSADSVVRYNSNIDAVLHLADAASHCGSVQRVLWASSQLVSRIGRIPLHDTDYDPDTSYGESKVITERIVRGLDGAGMEWAILRPTTVWGPGMSDHYLSLLRYLERRRYFHAGAARVPKSYSFVYNAVHQIERLMAAPAPSVHRQTFYIADDAPIELRTWCDALAAALEAPKVPVMPIPAARGLARVGDLLNATFMPHFKFNSFRLRNILTPYVFDTRNLQAVAGPQPYGFEDAVAMTASWYRDVVKARLAQSA